MSTESDVSLAPEQTAADVTTSASSFGRFAHLAAAYAVIVGVLWYIQSGAAGIIDPDGYYHIRWSEQLGLGFAEGRLAHFVWLPLTILNEHDYADHHFLFHVLQIPFTWFGDLMTGAKVSAVFYATLAYLACYALIVWSRVRYPLLWLLPLVTSSLIVVARMSLPRAPAVMLILLALTFWLLLTRRAVWLGVVAFVTVWTYSLFPLIGIFAFFWTVGVWLEERRIEWRPVVAAAVGIALGIVVNPYFPNNVSLLLAHVFTVLPTEQAVLGNEWNPITAQGLFVSSIVALVAQALGCVLWVARIRERSAATLMFGFASLFLFALTINSVRFVEYWAPIAVVFLAFAAKPFLEAWPAARSRPTRIAAAVGTAAALVAIAAHLAYFVVASDVSRIRSGHPEVYEEPAAWLRENTPPGSLVYNVAWEDFPPLYFFDVHNVYTSGLAPTYLSYEHPDLGKLHDEIERGKVQNPGAVIRDRFGARYIFVSTTAADFLTVAQHDPSLRVGYRTPHVLVLVVADAPPR
jgi:hypothetical protein